MKILIQHGRVVHPVTGTVLLQDLLIEDGKIALLDRGLETDPTWSSPPADWWSAPDWWTCTSTCGTRVSPIKRIF